MIAESWTDRLHDLSDNLSGQGTIDPKEARALQVLFAEVSTLAGRPEALVRTAYPLTPKEKSRFEDVLARRFAVRRVGFEVDPSLIGGVWLRVGERIIDGTLQSRLDALRRRLAAGEE